MNSRSTEMLTNADVLSRFLADNFRYYSASERRSREASAPQSIAAARESHRWTLWHCALLALTAPYCRVSALRPRPKKGLIECVANLYCPVRVCMSFFHCSGLTQPCALQARGPLRDEDFEDFRKVSPSAAAVELSHRPSSWAACVPYRFVNS